MLSNEERKTKELEEKLHEYRRAVESNGDLLTPKKRDAVIIDVLESTIDMRYLFLEMCNKFMRVAEDNKKNVVPERRWFIEKVLPGLVQSKA